MWGNGGMRRRDERGDINDPSTLTSITAAPTKDPIDLSLFARKITQLHLLQGKRSPFPRLSPYDRSSTSHLKMMVSSKDSVQPAKPILATSSVHMSGTAEAVSLLKRHDSSFLAFICRIYTHLISCAICKLNCTHNSASWVRPLPASAS